MAMFVCGLLVVSVGMAGTPFWNARWVGDPAGRMYSILRLLLTDNVRPFESRVNCSIMVQFADMKMNSRGTKANPAYTDVWP